MAEQGDKYEFLSPAWIDMARSKIIEALSGKDLAGLDFTLCEEFTDPPSHLRRAGSDTVGFCVHLLQGRVEVTGSPSADASLRIISDYQDALAIARNPDAPAAAPGEMEARTAAGKLRVLGDASAVPAVFLEADIHRLLTPYTA